MITDELVELALEKAENRKVKDLRAGLGYTCVMLDSRECGLPILSAILLANAAIS